VTYRIFLKTLLQMGTVVLLNFFTCINHFLPIRVKLSKCLTKTKPLRRMWGSRGIAPRTLSSALGRGELSPSRFGLLTPGKSPRTHLIGNCLGPTAGLDLPDKANISLILPRIEPRFLCRQFHVQVTIRFRDVRSF
jgi:hypothetical protein